MLSLKIPL